MQIQKGEAASSEKLNNDAWSPNNYLGKCPNVAKFHDYFTTCLPSPQKGDPVEIGTVRIDPRILPVAGLGSLNDSGFSSSELFPNDDVTKLLLSRAGYTPPISYQGVGPVHISNDGSLSGGVTGDLFANQIGYMNVDSTTRTTATNAFFDNLGAYDPGTVAYGINVNDLRLAIQTQKMLEKDARGGTRYREYILSHFGVSVADSRVQVPEFLGGKRSPLNVQQVAQTSQNTADSPLASLGAYSLSFGKAGFSKGFTEHGYIIGCMCLRYHHTYQQGVERYAFRKDRLDFYDPVFANIGEQPVYKKELFASAGANEVFGYQEPWADLRYRPSRVSGQLASKSTNTLDIYHFGDEFANAPTLSEGFINETDSNFSRTIAIDDAKANDSDQFVFDIYIENDAIRELPVYSVPSLMDHN